MNVIEELTKARSLLLLDHAFWGILAMRLKFTEEPLCDTAATDGESMLYNPKYIETLSLQEIVGLEAHEVMHPAMGDIWRLDERHPFIWNMACDYVNNLMLVDAHFTLPEGALLDNAYQNMSKEQVYNILMQNAQKSPQNQPGQGQGQGQGKKGQGQGQPGQGKGQDKYKDPGKCGSMFKPADPVKAKEGEVEWKTATTQAVQMSQGDLPANMRKTLKNDVLDPPLPWHIILRDFVQRTARNDYNWSRPSKRYLAREIILPGLISDELPMVVIGRDTSGSCDCEQERFANEVSGVLSSFNTTAVVIDCDARVQQVTEYKTEDLPIKQSPRGGGGTDFRPVFNYVQKEGLTPACLIYLTDMEGRFPSNEPDYPVLWISVLENKKQPFGELVEMKL